MQSIASINAQDDLSPFPDDFFLKLHPHYTHPGNRVLLLMQKESKDFSIIVDSLILFKGGIVIIDYKIKSRDSIAIIYMHDGLPSAAYSLLTYDEEHSYYEGYRVRIGEDRILSDSGKLRRLTRKSFSLVDLHVMRFLQYSTVTDSFIEVSVDLRHDIYRPFGRFERTLRVDK